jgi:dTDP-4-dehydrorhamnose reductase
MRIVITGSAGLIGSALARRLAQTHKVTGLDRRTSPQTDIRIDVAEAGVLSVLRAVSPEVIIHCAAEKSLAICEQDASCHADNVRSTRLMRDYATASGALLIFMSSDMVFGGQKGPYREATPRSPTNQYGRWKQQGEDLVLGIGGAVIRTALVFPCKTEALPEAFWRRPLDNQSLLVEYVLARCQRDIETEMFTNVVSNPTPIEWLTTLTERVVSERATGIFHACGPLALSRFEFARRICAAAGLRPEPLVPRVAAAGLRPHDLSLTSEDTVRRLALPLPDAALLERAIAAAVGHR